MDTIIFYNMHVACTRTKKAEEIGIKLVPILSMAVTPEILQLDNGNKFLGKCIRIFKTFYGYLHIVKGRTYHPQWQRIIERGHSTFKEVLQKWMESNGDNWVIREVNSIMEKNSARTISVIERHHKEIRTQSLVRFLRKNVSQSMAS
jgi:hypothetical protein